MPSSATSVLAWSLWATERFAGSQAKAFTAAAGNWLLAGLAVAGLVAFCNAMSSAWLAARYPESGGTYVYGRRRLGHFWGFLAGWAFVVGKIASCAAMAFTIGVYAWPEQARALAIGSVVALVAINTAGIQRTAAATRVILEIGRAHV